MTWQTLVLYGVTNFFISMIPGPNMLLALATGIRCGVGRAAWAGAGMCAALTLLATLSVLGLGAILTASAEAFLVIKWAGVAYLIWLGLAAWRAPVDDSALALPADRSQPQEPAWRLFRRGFLVSLSNPKALVFMTALFPQFLTPAAPLAPQLVLLVLVMVVIEFAWIMAYAAGGTTLAGRFSGPDAARWLNRLTGSLLIAAGGLLALVQHD